MRRAARFVLVGAAAATLLAAAPASAEVNGGGDSAADTAAGEASAKPGDGDKPPELARNRGARYDPRQEPAEGAAYQYRLMVFALVIMAATIACVVWLVRRQTRGRR